MDTSAHGMRTAGRYRTPARVLHWLVALAVLATLPVGQTMIQDGLPRSVQDPLFIFHKNIGVLILLAVLARLIYRARHPAPPLPDDLPGWQRAAAHTTHAALYVLLLTMAISGFVRVRAGGFPIEMLDALGMPSLVPRSDPLAEVAQAVHFYTRYLLVLFILLHVGAALQHGLLRRDGVFGRMWPPWPR